MINDIIRKGFEAATDNKTLDNQRRSIVNSCILCNSSSTHANKKKILNGIASFCLTKLKLKDANEDFMRTVSEFVQNLDTRQQRRRHNAPATALQLYNADHLPSLKAVHPNEKVIRLLHKLKRDFHKLDTETRQKYEERVTVLTQTANPVENGTKKRKRNDTEDDHLPKRPTSKLKHNTLFEKAVKPPNAHHLPPRADADHSAFDMWTVTRFCDQ